MEENSFICDECKNEVMLDSDFCPSCGAIFIENVKCLNHENREADGVCVICRNPYCEECGEPVNEIFLCKDHCEVEIYMSTARVNYNMDLVESQFIYELLTKEGLKPIQNSFNGFGRSGTSIVMVPLDQYLAAEKIIDEWVNRESNQSH